MQKPPKFPVHNRNQDGNAFEWILKAAKEVRLLRQGERLAELEKAPRVDRWVKG